MIKTPKHGAQVPSLVKELRSHMQHRKAKKKDSEKKKVYIIESLCCTSETNTIL